MRVSTALYGLSYYFVMFIILPLIFIKLNNFFHLPILQNIILHYLGLLVIILGLVYSFYSYFFFFTKGKGTPVPSQPTQKLITAGLYKYTRNPIYIFQFLLTTGIFFYFGNTLLIIYSLLFALWAHFYILHEEKGLKKRFRDEYIAYMKSVPRYFWYAK